MKKRFTEEQIIGILKEAYFAGICIDVMPSSLRH
ncbi:MAG: hypothetical protein H6R04_114 [Burkholderiaceae bacterium]|nr:hypothetical protein [Burkholderiaceae bacterium]